MFQPASFRTLARRDSVLEKLHFLLVYPSGPAWFVRGKPLDRTHRFPTKEEAIQFARGWAEVNRPCLVKLELDDRKIAGEWQYDDYPA